MRSKKAFLNFLISLISQIVSIICGFILPRLVLSVFGSSYNGITSSITQFISCIVLLRAGVGGVTRAALYKPLAENDNKKVSEILKATDLFMHKVAYIFAASLFIFACIYPVFVSSDFSWIFSFTLVLILGISTFVQSYFGITYQMLIQADQRLYIYSTIEIITTILNTILAAILIKAGCTIHIVKLGSAIVFALNPIVLNIYVRKRYKIDKNAKPDNIALSQRWDAFMQQAAAFVTNNSALIVLTIFSNVREISVYTVYYLVVNGTTRMTQTLSNGIGAAFGNMLAKNEKKSLLNNTRLFEFIIFSVSTIVFVCSGILITPFVSVYTKGVTDVNYYRPIFGYMACLCQFLFCVRLPYQNLVEAAGKFRETRNGAFFESISNISVSIILVIRYGLIGVTIGNLCAMLIRTVQYSVYASKNILNRSILIVFKRFFVSFLELITIILILKLIPDFAVKNYSEWIVYAVIVFSVVAVVVLIYSSIFFMNDMKDLLKKLYNMKKK